MIYSFTANLAIDLFIETDDLKANYVNRTNYCEYSANGKGVNVSIILKRLGRDSLVSGFKAGFTGEYIEREVNNLGLDTFFSEVDGITRVNVFTKVLNEDAQYTQVNPGPEISIEAKEEYLKFLRENIREGDIFSINGSFPKGIDREYIEEICSLVSERGGLLVIDNSSSYVKDLCKYRPYILKPNEYELCSWFGEEIGGMDQFIELSKKLIDGGAKNVLLSLGDKGALLVNEENIFYGNAPKGEVVNTAMAGDTLLGTFLNSILNGEDEKLALKKAISAGSSTAFREGLTDFSDMDDLMKEVSIKDIGGKYEI